VQNIYWLITRKYLFLQLFYNCMKFRNISVQFLIFFLIIFVSCKNNFRVNTSGIKVDIKIKRLEKDLFSIDPANIKNMLPSLREKYDGFLKYFGYVINIGESSDSLWAEGLVKFCTDKFNNEVYATTMKAYPDVANLEKELTGAFRYYKYYFPRKPVPEIYTCITGFNNSIITVTDSSLAIGLDKYLGSGCKYYPQLQIYSYQAARMNSFNILPDCMYAWATSEWDFKEMSYASDNVLTSIIHEGKLLYFVKSMLPDYDEKLLFGFTADQMAFCKKNESRMWQYLVENNLLFKTEQLTKRKLTGEAPFTAYFSKESPGRAAVWLGFRIIESYRKNDKRATLEEIMKDVNVQGILETAKYNPK
jgi:hypothetical protein